MKKLFIFSLAIGFILAPLMAVAATLSLSPANVSVTRGQTFTMQATLNPQGAKAYTVKVELSYPASLLEVQSFTFASGWLSLTQSGYDLVDNANGKLVKTAGYPGGISSPAAFGTVSFRAKASGSGNVTITANSSVFDANSQNTLIGAPVSASVAVSAPAATSTPSPITQTPTPTPEAEEEPAQEEAVVSGPEGGFNLFAALGTLVSLGTGNTFVGIVAVVVILAAAYVVYRRTCVRKE